MTSYTVKYGRIGDRHRYTHSHTPDLARAKATRDAWYGGGAFGIPQEELRVWVVDNATGAVVYGEALDA